MAFLNSLDISGSALTAERLRMDIISENIANAETTRTSSGGPYKRKMVMYQSADGTPSFKDTLDNELSGGSSSSKGVKVTGIVEDKTPSTPVYDPENPDADSTGYVQEPNVNVVKETVDMMAATRAYSANLTVLNAVKSMASKALEIGK